MKTKELCNDTGLHIPLCFNKPISYFKCRVPTVDEIENDHNLTIHMTSSVKWEPYDETTNQIEENIRRQVLSSEREIDSLITYPNPYVSSCPIALSQIISHFEQKVCGVKTSGKSYLIKPEQLARRWRTSLECATRTLKKTEQRALRDWTRVQGDRRFRPTQLQLRYPRINCIMYCDVKYGPCRSLEGNTCLVVYATKFQWAKAYPLSQEKYVSNSLTNLFRDVGFPSAIVPDNAASLTKGEFKKIAGRAQVPIYPLEPYNPNQSTAEDMIREATRLYQRFMTARNIPKVLWDRVFSYCLEIRSHMALGLPVQNGECGKSIIQGYTADISHIADFSMYDWCWTLSPSNSNQDRKQLARWLGPSFDVGGEVCYALLTAKAQIIIRSSVSPLKKEEINADDIKDMKKLFTMELNQRLESTSNQLNQDETLETRDYDKYTIPVEDSSPSFVEYEDDEEVLDKPTDINEEEDQVEYDKYISSTIRTMEDDMEQVGIIRGRKRGADGKFIGKFNTNPILDTSIYEVEFEDGRVESYHANQIAECILEESELNSNISHHICDFVDHRKTEKAISEGDSYIIVKGRKVPKRTVKGWLLCAELSNGSTEWIELKMAKDASPIKAARYAVANKISDEPAFRWWVPYFINKQDRIISAVKGRGIKRRKSEKFGLEVPRPNDIKRALKIDDETSSSHWRDALTREAKTVLPALKILDKNESVPPGYKYIELLTIFDIKMDLTRKARICARGDQTETPSSITYASVVTRESIRIAFVLASLNDLEILSADVAGAYLNAPCAEKVYTILGEEFGDYAGRKAVIIMALYGLKSAGYSWRTFCARILREELHFIPCRADMDVWRRAARKGSGERYYEYLFIYTDDIICISQYPREILKDMNKHFLLKIDSIQEPSRYLGASISKHLLDGDSQYTWAIGSREYLIESLRIVKQRIEPLNLKLKSKVTSALPSGYKPELDASDYLDDDNTVLYMQLIGILRWLVELGRIDICAEVSMMSSYNCMPRVTHLYAVLNIFSYLQANLDWKIVMDSAYNDHLPKLDKRDWSEFYPFAEKKDPPDMPEALGRAVELTMFVDASHATNLVTRQSRTGVLIYVNKAPIVWYSKKQNAVETSSFGSEFMALKTGVELLEGLVYKLQMMGVPIEGYCHTCVDNMSVVNNSSVPESVLRKKSNSIAYHYVRSKCAEDLLRITYENTKTNLADILTKVQSGTTKKHFRDRIMFPGD